MSARSSTKEVKSDLPARVTLFGVPIDNLSMAETLDKIEQMIREGGPTHQHVVVNVDKIVKLQLDRELHEAILECDIISADGQPVVWASRLLQRPIKERVAGIDLFCELLRRCTRNGFRPFLLGARQEVVARLPAILSERYPGLRLAGWRNGYWSPEEEAEVAKTIREARPDILFVAMSSPKKELFIRKWKQQLGVPFVMGVGGAFDVLAGVVKRAPRWMQRCGLEWLYRLAQEPRRLWRRYLVEDLAFFRLVACEWWAMRKKR
jgi:N-acetylglucosaminyldiphosphoundecaprenol N-acetyl-beta-D-mannosaminyltransferase